MNRETIAAIDIGSNAIRLLINYIEQDKGFIAFKRAAFIRVPIRLGEDVFTQGVIGDVKKERLSKAMVSFSHVMDTFNAKAYRACATSAMREAGNGKEIVEYIKETSGISIDIISGTEEAETIFKAGSFANLMGEDDSYIFVDVGGGSTEVTIYSNHERVMSKSFPLGTVRMISDAVDKAEWKEFKRWLSDVVAAHKPTAIIGSGGNINKIHKLLQKKEREVIKYAEMKEMYEQMKLLSFDERIRMFKLNAYRADVIMPAMKIFTTCCKCCSISDVVVPKVGLADGVIHELYHKMHKGEQ